MTACLAKIIDGQDTESKAVNLEMACRRKLTVRLMYNQYKDWQNYTSIS
jgi:hypothetical protein